MYDKLIDSIWGPLSHVNLSILALSKYVYSYANIYTSLGELIRKWV